ncbi:hypothetical protein JAO71_12560 [Olleya sp. YSTF-M6]|uniref:Uncharacterized protein n=1 Tax=Olleya sediminilitoris TaxID=2795739 RepID=A0ABS1WNE9_9FLAO|nr:hypothetical protein [Olleya sediminilitoris]MBL7560632.1 hypothetical protein [Olleya sediminilitoris]
MNDLIKYEVGSTAIQNLFMVSNDIELAFQYLKSQTKDEDLKTWIDDKLNYTVAFKVKSLNILKTLSIRPKQRKNWVIKIKLLWFGLKRQLYKNQSQLILKECMTLNNYFLNEVNKEIKSGILSKPSYQLLNTLKDNLLQTKQAFYFSQLKIS